MSERTKAPQELPTREPEAAPASSGRGADSALQEMIRKRRMQADPEHDGHGKANADAAAPAPAD